MASMPAAVLIFLGAIGLVQAAGLVGLAALIGLALLCLVATALLGLLRKRDSDDSAAGGDLQGTTHRTEAQASGSTAGSAARSANHFTRHATTPGWIYVARNDLHAPDLYKVGYTTVSPRARMATLNQQGEGVTVAVGEFRLLHARRVPKSYTAEQQVFDRLAVHRARRYREFFQAPLSTVLAAVNAVADEMAQAGELPASTCLPIPMPGPVFGAVRVTDTCQKCGATQPHAASESDGWSRLTCGDCGFRWFIGVRWNDSDVAPEVKPPTA